MTFYLVYFKNVRYVWVLFFFLIGCKKKEQIQNKLSTGVWRAELVIKEGVSLPFIFEIHHKNKWSFYNAQETIIVDEISIKNDSVQVQFPVYEGYIKARIKDSVLTGHFIKPSLDRIVPFRATLGKTKRFQSKKPEVQLSGNWETVFSDQCDTCRYVAKGTFKQVEGVVTGTFRTTTGDYRYLEGVVSGDSLKLSTFDGAHAFLFEAVVTDSTMQGTFYSGNHFEEPFYGKRNETFELADEDSLTYLKSGFNKFYFEFPDANGKIISLDDPKFKNKVVLIQILGSWCPNCLDETKYYSSYYRNNKNDNLAFVGLAFEYAKTPEKAFKSIHRLTEKIKVPYPILLAQYGTVDKKEAQKKVPMLNQVLSYPTSIFLDKQGVVRRIHTGFNGPATGEKYTLFKKDFESFLTKLLQEE
ncbi:peroxiredoxin family protein [Ascidiimonas sp. W6]|uniref:peroxiredoxin family protein n=1 Tax=Ascidiimonas meishanensis TaxID=3128903 RepID=UPI0030ED5567